MGRIRRHVPGVAMPNSPTRREFLSAATAAALPLGAACGLAAVAAKPQAAKSCIFINLVGGPAHLDTFDPKPTAPSGIRGPFRPIPTRVPGVHLSELFPKLANLTDKFSLIRSMHHTAPPIHEAGFQLLNTGRLFRDGPEWPSVGAVVSHLLGERDRCSAWWHLGPRSIETGISVSHGQGAGFLTNPDAPPIAKETTIVATKTTQFGEGFVMGVRVGISVRAASFAFGSGCGTATTAAGFSGVERTRNDLSQDGQREVVPSGETAVRNLWDQFGQETSDMTHPNV